MIMFEPIKKYATFSGRARRKEYWLFFLFYWVGYVILAIIDSATGTMTPSAFGLLSGIFSLVFLIPWWAVIARRLHDIDKSGGWFFIVLIPLIGTIVLLVFMCLDGTSDDNRFGPDPKGREKTS